MSEELKCLACGNPARWCDSKPDEDGEYHQCEHIHCDHCNMHYSIEPEGDDPIREAESFEEMKAIMLERYTASPEELAALRGETTQLKWLLSQIMNDLPSNRDWLNPDFERMAKALLQGQGGEG